MFCTYEDAELPFGTPLYKGTRSWRYIEWGMNTPWFWITMVLDDGDADWTETLMLSFPQDIADLLEQHTDSLKTIDVQLVCPPRMNTSNRWTMEPVVEIVCGTAVEVRRTVHVFKCVGGRSYFDDHELADVPQLINRRTIFSAAA